MPKNHPMLRAPDWYSRLSREPSVRLLLVPFIVYLVWLFEMYLLEGRCNLFLDPDPFGLILYTVVCCIFIGTVVPVLIIRRSFVSGDVTMFQLGFRSWYRTVTGIVFTLLALGVAMTIQIPFDGNTRAFFLMFLLLLPTGIASVMVCWVLAGTHIQALVRSGGALLSIPVGVAVTAILFGLSSKVQFPATTTPDTLFWYIVAGIAAAIFFFLVRDVWSTAVLVTGELVYLSVGWFDLPGYYPEYFTLLISALVSIGSLIVIHWHLSRHFLTIPAPAA